MCSERRCISSIGSKFQEANNGCALDDFELDRCQFNLLQYDSLKQTKVSINIHLGPQHFEDIRAAVHFAEFTTLAERDLNLFRAQLAGASITTNASDLLQR